MNQMEDKRRQPRFEVCLTARWSGSTADVRISDLSEGGCYLDTIIEATVSEALLLQILRSDGEWFELQGIVAHHTPRLGFGVRFVNLSAQQRDFILSLLPNGSARSSNAEVVEDSGQNENPGELQHPHALDFTSSVM